MSSRALARALTIAGSDSGGGAGIQADLKTFHELEVFGTSAVTAVTAQNTVRVTSVYALPPTLVVEQVRAVVEDLGVDAAKTGMLARADIVEAVADAVQRFRIPHLVVDPVLVAKGGDPLLEADAVAVLRRRLLPLAEVVTPNWPEAEVLVGHPMRSLADLDRALSELQAMGPRVVMVKGGHAPGHDRGWPDGAVDWVAIDGERFRLHSAWIESRNTHGTGCTLSSAATAMLARGTPPLEALQAAKRFVLAAIRGAATRRLGAGHGPLAHRVGDWAVEPVAIRSGMGAYADDR